MRIRRAAMDDLPGIIALEEHCFGHERFSKETLQAFVVREDAFALLAEEEGRVIGTALCLFSQWRREGRVASVAVGEECRRRGVGSALLAEAEAQLERCGASIYGLEVETGNGPAICMYRKHGYNIIAVIRDYYGPDRHAYVMEKALPPKGEKVKVRIS